MKAIHYAV